MAFRKIAEFKNESARVVVSFNSEVVEFRCRLDGKPEADYFTNDREEATNTALAMLEHEYRSTK